jgi:hypothetical protein
MEEHSVEENGRLLEAAPVLYEALTRLTEAIEALMPQLPRLAQPKMACRIAGAHGALAKAEGREP